MPALRDLSKADFEALAEWRYQLRRFLRFSEEAAKAQGLTPLQYQLLLQIRGCKGRSWALVGELASLSSIFRVGRISAFNDRS